MTREGARVRHLRRGVAGDCVRRGTTRPRGCSVPTKEARTGTATTDPSDNARGGARWMERHTDREHLARILNRNGSQTASRPPRGPNRGHNPCSVPEEARARPAHAPEKPLPATSCRRKISAGLSGAKSPRTGRLGIGPRGSREWSDIRDYRFRQRPFQQSGPVHATHAGMLGT